jgi:hypothetical protein
MYYKFMKHNVKYWKLQNYVKEICEKAQGKENYEQIEIFLNFVNLFAFPIISIFQHDYIFCSEASDNNRKLSIHISNGT